MKCKRVDVWYKERKKERRNLCRDGRSHDSQDTKHKAQWFKLQIKHKSIFFRNKILRKKSLFILRRNRSQLYYTHKNEIESNRRLNQVTHLSKCFEDLSVQSYFVWDNR